MDLKQIVDTVVRALEDIKGREIVVLDTTRLTSMFDKMVIASADSTRQTKALSDNVQDKLKAAGGTIYGVEGEQAGEWILVDAGEVIVHIMQPAVRSYYDLEQLWSAAARPARAAGA
ncbi:MAG TPA: ribosome silencing factor [Burkholderiales bacterium]|jgi:ribosome-associated protein|nr:ribosome silencing factor [Burkholderiales bacterium]